MSEKHYQNLKINKLEKSEVEIEGEISAELLENKRKESLKKFVAEAEIPGFRKGKAPEKMVAERIGEMVILQGAAERALQEEYPHILFDQKIEAIGQPQVSITKLAPGNPIGFKIRVAVMPELILPDYKKIAQDHDSHIIGMEATDKEVEESVEQIRKNMAMMRAKTTEKSGLLDKDGKPISSKDPASQGAGDLPEIDDKSVKKLGDFKDVGDFKLKLKEGITKEKEAKERDKKRGELIDKIINESKTEIPDILIESELDRLIGQFKEDIKRSGFTFEKYLEEAEKTEADIRNEWKDNAEKKAKFQLILNKIAVEENIEADHAKVDQNTKHILEHHKDADPTQVKIYITTLLTNEKVIEHLENISKKS